MAKHSFESALNEARGYCKAGQEQEAALLFLLKELEPQSAVWGEYYDSFDLFYSEEALCAKTRYRKFKAATKVFPRAAFEKFGVSACILIAALPAKIRSKVHQEAIEFEKEYKIPLTPQRVTALINKVVPDRVKKKPGVRQLKGHIKKLEAMLLSYGVQPPDMVSTDVAIASAAFLRAKHDLQKHFGAKTSDTDLTKQAMKAAGVDNVRPLKKKKKAA